jgi:hypothetical protein
MPLASGGFISLILYNIPGWIGAGVIKQAYFFITKFLAQMTVLVWNMSRKVVASGTYNVNITIMLNF